MQETLVWAISIVSNMTCAIIKGIKLGEKKAQKSERKQIISQYFWFKGTLFFSKFLKHIVGKVWVFMLEIFKKKYLSK